MHTEGLKKRSNTMINVPAQVYIGPYIYKVIKRDESWYNDTEAYGNSWVDKKIINVSCVGDPANQLDTFLHECLHAMWALFHMEKKVREEEAVSKLSTGTLLLLRQNPEILDLMYEVFSNDKD